MMDLHYCSAEAIEQLHRLWRIDARALAVLTTTLIGVLELMAALDGPRWLAIVWLCAWNAFYLRWTVVVMRIEDRLIGADWTDV